MLLRPIEGGIVMQQLRYADEIRSIGDVPRGDTEVKPGELELALQIVDQAVSEKFRPEAYEDDVKKRMLAAIERKVEGQEVMAEPSEEPKAQVIDLMEALKASLVAKGAARKPAKRAAASRTKAKSAAKKAGAKRSRG